MLFEGYSINNEDSRTKRVYFIRYFTVKKLIRNIKKINKKSLYFSSINIIRK